MSNTNQGSKSEGEGIGCLIKNLQSILSAYNIRQIDEETYKKELNSICEKIEKNKGIPPELLIKMLQYFNDLDLILETENIPDSESLTVSDIIMLYFELYNSLVDLQKFINLQNDNISKVKQCYSNLKKNRNAADILSEEEKKQMKMDLSVACSTIIKQFEQLDSSK